MRRIPFDTTVTTRWRASPRGIFRDREAERLDRELAGSLRLVDIRRHGQHILYIDLSRGEYRELSFDDREDGRAGSASLTRVSVDYVKGPLLRHTRLLRRRALVRRLRALHALAYALQQTAGPRQVIEQTVGRVPKIVVQHHTAIAGQAQVSHAGGGQ